MEMQPNPNVEKIKILEIAKQTPLPTHGFYTGKDGIGKYCDGSNKLPTNVHYDKHVTTSLEENCDGGYHTFKFGVNEWHQLIPSGSEDYSNAY